MPQYQPIVDGVLKDARNELGEGATDQAVANLAFLSASPSPSARRFSPSFRPRLY
ncbi:MAG: hypothetical protein WDM87_06665 [Terracidiphilus sp.]